MGPAFSRLFVTGPSHDVDISRRMDQTHAIDALTALAQPTRLSAFRHLVAAHPEAVPAGEIARRCDVPHNTMSTHLAILMRAGLLSVTRESRSMLYRADLDGFRALVAFLTRDCCRGRPEICAPLFGQLEADCSCEPEPAHG
jgi:DNA-binding transcriptional ArsR family regulator